MPWILTTFSLLGKCSTWFGYLQSLPRTTVGIGLLWGIDEAWADGNQGHEVRADARQAAALAAGTEIARELLGEDGGDIVVSMLFAPTS